MIEWERRRGPLHASVCTSLFVLLLFPSYYLYRPHMEEIEGEGRSLWYGNGTSVVVLDCCVGSPPPFRTSNLTRTRKDKEGNDMNAFAQQTRGRGRNQLE